MQFLYVNAKYFKMQHGKVVSLWNFFLNVYLQDDWNACPTIMQMDIHGSG